MNHKVLSRLAPFLACAFAVPVAATHVACGGNNPPATAPSAASATAPLGGTSSGEPSTASSGTGGTSSTTLAVGDGEKDNKLGDKLPAADAGAKAPHTAEPGRSRDDIQARVQARRDEARACYDEGVKKHPGIEGDLVVRWVIDPKGEVTQAEVDTMKSQIMEPSVGDCVVGVIKKLKFPESAKGFETKASYPFNFRTRPASPKK